MRALSLYEDKGTVLHRKVDPLTKLIYLGCSIVVAFMAPNTWFAVGVLVVNVVLLTVAKELSRAIKTILGSLVVIASVFVIQGLFNPHNHTLVFTLGPVHVYKEGLLFAVILTFRVINVIAASCILVLTTSPVAVMEACVRRGLSPKLGYVVTSILQMVPAMLSSAVTIREAQQSRGMRLQGRLWTRIKAFIPLVAPIVLSSFMTIQDRAMALEVRGFSVRTKKTFYNEEYVPHGMVWLRLGLLFMTAIVVVWGIVR